MDLRTEQLSSILNCITEDTKISLAQVDSTVKLLLEGGTVPFIARYRKEKTGELDEVGVREIEKKYKYYLALEERRNTILLSIASQDKLSDQLAEKINNTFSKTELEDLYLPYKPKRRTKATIAREQGLEPLADIIQKQELTSGNPNDLATDFIAADKGVNDCQAAIQGAAYIIAERLNDNADIREIVRQDTREMGVMVSHVSKDYSHKKSKYNMYYDYSEKFAKVPSHRLLAMRRGLDEKVLQLSLEAPVDTIITEINALIITHDSIFKKILTEIVIDAYQRLLAPSIEKELFNDAKVMADDIAIKVFADNLQNLLLAPPAGGKVVLGIDPGLRTGSKCVIVDSIGRFLDHKTIYPHTSKNKVAEANTVFVEMVQKWKPELVAIGNGTAGREMEQFARAAFKKLEITTPIVMVSESGASIYSASDLARLEFPDLDLTIRGAISIARRLQDPLSELVKLDPKNIGVGQYQHDVNQVALHESLDSVVESCVNYVGVELNTASWSLLAYVSGVGMSLAKSIVTYRDQNGQFTSRRELLKVGRFGKKAFEQSAGFLRIRAAKNALDTTAIHPERYKLVQAMAKDLGVTVSQLINSSELITKIKISEYQNDEVGMPTLNQIITELKKPGLDPREEFVMAEFRDDVMTVDDLDKGMVLQGSITNVTNFGAFVDIGVHQDGLVHISHLANKYVSDPNEIVKVGMIVKVKVLDIDKELKRISLSIKEASQKPSEAPVAKKEIKKETIKKVKKKNEANNSAFDDLDDLFS